MGHPTAQQLSTQPQWGRRPDRLPSGGSENRKSQIVNRKSPNLSAFTLIELMVVIVLIGVMAAMILPEMKGTYEDALLRSTSRELVSVCGLAASHAVSVNQAHRLWFDRKTGHYSIARVGSDHGPEGRLLAAREVPGGEGELDSRIAIEIHASSDDRTETAQQVPSSVPAGSARAERRDDAITFYPDGTADASEIVLQDRDGFRLALRINPITARVRIIELARK